MRKLLPALAIIFLSLISIHVHAQINIGVVDNGPYGRESSISVPISVSGNINCLSANNIFELYISDINGNFGNETKIGESSGFFSTHVNGTIPANLNTGNNYKLRIKTTSPQSTIAYGGNINIVGVTGPEIEVLPSQNNEVLSSGVYGWCGSAVGNNKAIILKQSSTSETVTSLDLKNELTGFRQTYAQTAMGFSLDNLPVAYYTITIRGQRQAGADLVISNKTYLLLNTPSKVNIQSGGTDFGCIDPETGTGADISYSVNISGESGIQNNYPGSIYLVTWGDGKEDRLNHCELMASGGALVHNYKKTSCGEPPINLGNGTMIENSFRVSVTTLNPFCQSAPVSATTYPKIFSRPVAHIDPATATAVCLNTPVTFSNASTRGNNSNCSLAMQWKWYVDDVLMSTDEIFIYTGFATPGIHVVKLVANNDVGICRPSEDIRTICVQRPPQASFNFNGTSGATGCTPAILKPANTSVIDDNCNARNTYLWNITGGPVDYISGNQSSREPEFRFNNPGIYKISLSITTESCGAVTTPEQTVIINSAPAAVLSPDVTLCSLMPYDFSIAAGPTKTELTGTQETGADTYTWTVTGGDYSFGGNTDMHSRYPNIVFKEYRSYTITIVHKNNCGTATAVQRITFSPSPIINPGIYAPICYNESVVLQGNISGGTVSSQRWVGGTGVFNPGRTDLNATYTPSPEERLAGKTDLILRAVTPLAAPCNIIDVPVSIPIKPLNVLSSDPEKTICTGKSVAYTPVAETGSTFKWVVSSSANASGFTPSGNGTLISDVLTNTSSSAVATVNYHIIPVLNNCDGEVFELTVKILPNPIVIPASANPGICSGIAAGITLSSNQTGILYIWTSSTSGGQITGNTDRTIAAPVTEINDLLINNGSGEGTVTYTITPVSAEGCYGSPVNINVRVKPAPNLSNNVISQSQIRCEGQAAAALTGSTPTGGDGIYNYQWQSSTDGATWADVPGATSINFNPGILPVTTDYRRIASNLTCASTSQIVSNVAAITINLNAKALFSFISDKGCVPFTIDAANITAADDTERNGIYTWYANGVQIGTGLQFPGYTISNDNTSVEIKLIVSSLKGCASAEMSHTFSSQQTILAAFGQDKTDGCGPLTVSFQNQSTTLTNTTFEWDFGNGQTSDQVTPDAIVFLPDPTGKDKTYSIKLTATSTCGVSVPFTSTVLVRSQPISMFSPERTTGCSPLPVIFSNTSPEASNTTYTYDFGDGTLPLVTNDRSSVSHTFNVANLIQTFVVKMTAKSPCGEHTSEHTITVSPNTVISELVVNGPDQRGCAPFTVPFFNNSTGADSFAYDFGDGSNATTVSSPERVEHTFTKAGVYTITLTATNGCSTSATSETITVLPQPQVSFTASRNEDCTGLEVDFTNTSIDGISYLWDFGDGNTSIEKNPVHIYQRTGNYKVKLLATNLNGCKDTETNDLNVTGVPGNLFIPNAFNPGGGNPELRLLRAKGSGLKSWRFSIFDKWGELIWETNKLDDGKPAEGWDGIFKGREMPQGVYFWKADVQFINGTEWKGMSYGSSASKRTGVVNLIR